MNDSIRNASAYTLANMAGVDGPQESWGAEWLTDLRDAAVERFDYLANEGRTDEGDDWSDLAHELLAENDYDAPYVVGTVQAWSIFVDLGAWDVDLSDLGVNFSDLGVDDVSKIPAVALGIVAGNLLTQVLEALAGEAGEPYVCEARLLWSEGEFSSNNREGSAIDAWQYLAQGEDDARMREVAALDRDDSEAVHAFYCDHGLNNDEGSQGYGTGELHGVLSSDGMAYTYRVSYNGNRA
jgi:hypothetical protein